MKALVVTLLLAAACAGAGRSRLPEPAGRATLVVHLDKAEFFEGEPIYVVIELRNPGLDTVRVAPFSLLDSWMSCRLRGGTLDQSQQTGVIVDYFTGPQYDGDPLAPGESKIQPVVLQGYWGLPGPMAHSLYLRRLSAGTYSFACALRPWRPGNGRELTPGVVAADVTVPIRSGQGEEAGRVGEFERLAARLDVLKWQAEEFDSVLAWSARRLAADSADPFVPVVLASALTKAAVTGRGADSTRLLQAQALARAIVAFRPGSARAAYLRGVGDVRR
jgi:hypothetical protein